MWRWNAVKIYVPGRKYTYSCDMFNQIFSLHPFVSERQPCRYCKLFDIYWNCQKNVQQWPSWPIFKEEKIQWYWKGYCWTNDKWIMTLYNNNDAVGSSTFKIHHYPYKKCGENIMKTCHQQKWEKLKNILPVN